MRGSCINCDEPTAIRKMQTACGQYFFSGETWAQTMSVTRRKVAGIDVLFLSSL
jgi:hypothetical protein